jgi:LmbE family N-acetylglucosaminyl deacetylase
MRCSIARAATAACIAVAWALAAAVPRVAQGQDRSAVRLQQLVRGLTVTPRVLIVGAHPDDDDPRLIAWLARGHSVETAYFSLTRGEAGENFIGIESGVSLGAMRTAESMAARRIDGGISFFGRAFDFGIAKSAQLTFKRWPAGQLVTDLIQTIRSFRPQVIIVAYTDSVSDGNGQHQAASVIARSAFEAASDSIHFPAQAFGVAWRPLKLYHFGNGGPTIDAAEYDALLGKTYEELGTESRAQHRSQGLIGLTAPKRRSELYIHLAQVEFKLGSAAEATGEKSIFDGIDTTFARFGDSTRTPAAVTPLMATIATYADSARSQFDRSHADRLVPYLAKIVATATAARVAIPWCKHPTLDAAPPAVQSTPCGTQWLDVDASVDLIRRRAIDALLLASNVTITATADRELLSEADTVASFITIANHGTAPIKVDDISVLGATYGFRDSTILEPDSARRFSRDIAGLAESRPWWVGARKNDLFQSLSVAVDGVHRANGVILKPLVVPGVTVPEELHRTSDVSVTLTIAGTTFTTSAGPVIYRAADPQIGIQDRVLGAVPPVTLAFERGLEWFQANKPIKRDLRLSLKSYSDLPQTFALEVVSPPTLHVEALPKSVTLAPHEQRELFLHLRGSLSPGREEFGIVGQSPTLGKLLEGFLPLVHPHIPPTNYYHSSALYLQAVDINVPSRLMMAYVPGIRDDLDAMLRQLDVPGVAIDAGDLLQVDLSKFTTLVIGPRAFEVHPELMGQKERMLDFVRNGGTMVVLGAQYATTQSGVLPYPAVLSRPTPEHVTVAESPITVLDPKSRLLNWPNAIHEADWENWVRERALFVPTAVDSHYSHVIETHDPGEKENANSLLVTHLGKGTFIYSSLTFSEQMPAGIQGAARLLVNLLSAGCKSTGASSGAGC